MSEGAIIDHKKVRKVLLTDTDLVDITVEDESYQVKVGSLAVTGIGIVVDGNSYTLVGIEPHMVANYHNLP